MTRRVDAAGRRVVELRAGHRGEALVVAEVEVGLGAVVGDVDLAVLERRHRAGVDVDVRVELGHRDREAAGLEQRPDRGGRDALAERRNHAAGDEDVLRAHETVSSFVVPTSSQAPSAWARSSGVSTPIESPAASPTQIACPASSHRSCSSDSARSSGDGGRRRDGLQRVARGTRRCPRCLRYAGRSLPVVGDRRPREVERAAVAARPRP